MNFALRSRGEHHNLRHNPPQIELIEKPGERAYLKYTEDVSKNHPGGLKGRKHNPKVVLHHETTNNPSRCFVHLFKLYQSKCSPDRLAGAFYLKPLKNPRGACWYASQPIGCDKLNGTIARICKAAGIQVFKTNHSLRATAATRLYRASIDEQIIMETTGHRSLDSVRSYKHTSAQQKESISYILSLTKRFKPTDHDHEPETSHAPTQSKTAINQDRICLPSAIALTLTSTSTFSLLIIRLNIVSALHKPGLAHLAIMYISFNNKMKINHCIIVYLLSSNVIHVLNCLRNQDSKL